MTAGEPTTADHAPTKRWDRLNEAKAHAALIRRGADAGLTADERHILVLEDEVDRQAALLNEANEAITLIRTALQGPYRAAPTHKQLFDAVLEIAAITGKVSR